MRSARLYQPNGLLRIAFDTHRGNAESYNPGIISFEVYVRRLVIILCLVCFASSIPARSAFLAPLFAQGADPQFGRRRNEMSPDEQQRERDRVRALNKERQQKLKQDTDKLLQLATELKEYVDKTNENVLSVEVVKKTDEIEKLAKSIREKMKTAYEVPEQDRIPQR
jgi:hypothetical protein